MGMGMQRLYFQSRAVWFGTVTDTLRVSLPVSLRRDSLRRIDSRALNSDGTAYFFVFSRSSRDVLRPESVSGFLASSAFTQDAPIFSLILPAILAAIALICAPSRPSMSRRAFGSVPE